jgi:DeoR/GlpR family transcriptional regulator of sugar metabolism
MLKKERQHYILHQVNLHNKVLSSLLSREIRVSEDTIRRDLQELADEGKIMKVHGGALSHSFNEVYSPSDNTLQPIHICDIQHIDVLITELPPDDARLRPYIDRGIEVL